jgi:hypothetical protein
MTKFIFSVDKTKIIRARVTDADWDAFHRLMEMEGLNHSELLRYIVRDALKRGGILPPQGEK